MGYLGVVGARLVQRGRRQARALTRQHQELPGRALATEPQGSQEALRAPSHPAEPPPQQSPLSAPQEAPPEPRALQSPTEPLRPAGPTEPYRPRRTAQRPTGSMGAPQSPAEACRAPQNPTEALRPNRAAAWLLCPPAAQPSPADRSLEGIRRLQTFAGWTDTPVALGLACRWTQGSLLPGNRRIIP